MGTKGLVVAVLVGVAVTGLASEARAAKDDMQIRFGIVNNTPTDDYVDGIQKTEFDDTVGLAASFEYMATDMIGLEPAITTASYDVTTTNPGTAFEIDAINVTANLNFHVQRDGGFDLFGGPTIGYAFWGDLESSTFSTDVPTDDEFLYGINFGVDVPLGKKNWGFSAAFNYLFSDVEPQGSGVELGVDPVQLKVGVSYKF